MIVTTAERRRVAYRVVEHRVVRDGEAAIRLDVAGAWLTLATCYPFDAIVPGGPLRYVVTAEADDRRDDGGAGAQSLTILSAGLPIVRRSIRREPACQSSLERPCIPPS